jgi:hypothetical protein
MDKPSGWEAELSRVSRASNLSGLELSFSGQ